MKTLGVREIRASYTVLVDTLAQEGEVLLTHHGKPFARVLPLEQAMTEVTKSQVQSLKWLRDRMQYQEIGSDVIVREDRDTRD